MPLVSVIVPLFNSERYLQETIAGVLAQTFRDFEIILMDDGSKDSTAKIVRSFNDPRIRYFYKENEGLSETRNKAIRESKGELIAFLDHDDVWLEEKLAKEVALLTGNDALGLVYSDAYILFNDKTSGVTYFKRSNPKKGMILKDLLFDSVNFIPLPTVLMKRKVFDEVGDFNKDFKIGEEYELFLRVAEKYEFDYVDEPLAKYRIHNNSFSNKKDLFVKEHFMILDIWKNKRPDLFISDESKNRVLRKEADLYNELGTFYALNLNKDKALDNLKLSLEKKFRKNTAIKKIFVQYLGVNIFKIIFNLISGPKHG